MPPALFGFMSIRVNIRFLMAILFACIPCLVTSSSYAAIRGEAYRGEPFGIGRVTIDLSPGAAPTNDDRFAIQDADGRLIYPVIEGASQRPVRQILRNLLNVETPSKATFFFMFRGNDPLELTAYVPGNESFTIEPRDNPDAYNELLNDWWEATTGRFERTFRAAEYPVVVENYLTATWARRLDRPMPLPSRELLGRFKVGQPWLSQLFVNEAYQTEVERDLLLGRFGSDEPATRALPVVAKSAVAERDAVDSESAAPPSPESIEPLAAHVPEECFYLRFGNFTNYLWFRDFLRHWQGDLGNMLVMQSVDYDKSERFQQQIAIGESKLSRVMGPAVIRDVAIIGLDMYLRDGATMGLVFQANNNLLLGRNLSGQRQEAMNRFPGSREEKLRIQDHDVSFIRSSDGRIRSYYVVDGDFHLVANSRRLVERFLEAGAGKGTLASLSEFHSARQAMPVTREDSVFLFASSKFFENLAGPHYRVELDRRLRSVGEIRLYQLARMAAQVEGSSTESIGDLIAVELLPEDFGRRADGSKLVIDSRSNESARDSLRGQPGWMTPVADMPVERVTDSELRRYSDFRRELDASISSFAPVAMAIKQSKSPRGSDLDRITIDVRITPFSQMPIARWPNLLGPATKQRVAPIEGDVASLQLTLDALGDPVLLFGGLQDFQSPLVVREGEVRADVAISEFIRAYVGSWPRPHLFDRFLGRPGEVDNDGIARSRGLFDLWLRESEEFFLFSFQREVLLEVGQQLAMIEARTPAQIRLRIDDLHDKQIANAVTALGYSRAREASASGSRFMNSLITQLHVRPQDARKVAEGLVGGSFKCPLGGEYELVDAANASIERAPQPPTTPREDVAGADAVSEEVLPDEESRVLWASTATAPENRFLLTVIPQDYMMPLMSWFRGLAADVANADDTVTLHAELDMIPLEIGPPEDPTASASGIRLPGIGNLFGGLGAKQEKSSPTSTERAGQK